MVITKREVTIVPINRNLQDTQQLLMQIFLKPCNYKAMVGFSAVLSLPASFPAKQPAFFPQIRPTT